MKKWKELRRTGTARVRAGSLRQNLFGIWRLADSPALPMHTEIPVSLAIWENMSTVRISKQPLPST